MKNQKNRNNGGFSLVELIVVIAIMAVLIAVLAPTFSRYIDRSRQSNDATTVSEVIGAVQTGVADVVAYEIAENSDVTYTLTFTSAGLTVTKGGTTVDPVSTGKGNIVNAIKDSCGELTDLKMTAKAWPSTGVTVQIVVKNDNRVEVNYTEATFASYIGKNTASGS